MEPKQMLEIKKGSIVRTMKEYSLYKKELVEAQSKLESIKATGDEHEVKWAQNLVNETTAVLEDTKKRLTGFASDLDQFMREKMKPLVKDPSAPRMLKSMFLECKTAIEELTKTHPEIDFKSGQKTEAQLT
ncbi:Tubulin binding cofactor A family protein [Theileria parva strain Muguga]|uniref:Tubulin-specific chaperone A n=1 Tax=Theileria parva TaxID=5875 RepID=Q4N1V4_THEPA|nr:Tubulin binding cofactor A family protein [Theileria parva strain Muguga]EAN31975.1 Tubulin binding cofactor A family protein [Theileria parva strain Muguga]|eukprot:XP_764258.1 hypothetical protein [Theileria parva strain Muguga]